jgi:hypothetical protein
VSARQETNKKRTYACAAFQIASPYPFYLFYPAVHFLNIHFPIIR